jgi:hypothetical protein
MPGANRSISGGGLEKGSDPHTSVRCQQWVSKLSLGFSHWRQCPVTPRVNIWGREFSRVLF